MKIPHGAIRRTAIDPIKPIDGFYTFNHYRIADYFINCMVSTGGGWDHVSVTISARFRKVERCPTWEEMCFVKDQFFAKDECCIQFHPKESDYVSNHEFCLHIWKPQDIEIPTPPSIMVGIKDIEIGRIKF